MPTVQNIIRPWCNNWESNNVMKAAETLGSQSFLESYDNKVQVNKVGAGDLQSSWSVLCSPAIYYPC